MRQYRHESQENTAVINTRHRSETTRISFSLPYDLRRRIENEANKEDRNVSNFLVHVLTRSLTG